MGKFHGWQSVKVINENSDNFDRAGYVVRVETSGDKEAVFVQLDANATQEAALVTFEPSELAGL